MRFKWFKRILEHFGLLWQALKKFNDDNGFFLSAGIAFNLLINLIPFSLLLLALVGTVLYNDQEVLNYIHAYCMFFLIYKIIPDKGVHFRSALQAVFFAGLLWELAKHLFTWYVVHLAKYSIFYGSLSTLVIFVLWVYYSSMVLVVGAELAYFLEEDRQGSAAWQGQKIWRSITKKRIKQ